VALVVLAVLQVVAESHEASGVSASEIAAAQRIIPPGACVATDQASYTIAMNRFVSAVPGCSLMIDGVGTDYAMSNGRHGQTGAGRPGGGGGGGAAPVRGRKVPRAAVTQRPRDPGAPEAAALLKQPLRAADRGPRLALRPVAAPRLIPPLTRPGAGVSFS